MLVMMRLYDCQCMLDKLFVCNYFVPVEKYISDLSRFEWRYAYICNELLGGQAIHLCCMMKSKSFYVGWVLRYTILILPSFSYCPVLFF